MEKIKITMIILLALQIAMLTLPSYAIDDDGDGIEDNDEMEIAERFSPTLHTHSYDEQAGLASMEEWTEYGSGLLIDVAGTNVQGSYVQDMNEWSMFYDPEPHFHQSFNHGQNFNAPACSWGYKLPVTMPDARYLELDFPYNKRHASATVGERPIYFHCYYSGAYFVNMQYWYFLASNDVDGAYHEGDWEHVDIKMQVVSVWPGVLICTPISVNFFQHHGGYTRDTDECWWSNDEGEMVYGWDPDHNHLNVWLAANAHASYNRYDDVYKVIVSIPIAGYYNEFPDNVDYGRWNTNVFESDLLINLGELSYDGGIYCWIPNHTDWMDNHWQPVGDLTPDWLAWSGLFGGDFETLSVPFVYEYHYYPPTSPAHHAQWYQFPDNHEPWGNAQLPLSLFGWDVAWIEYQEDPPDGDTPNLGVTPVTQQYGFDHVKIGWWPLTEAYDTEEYKVYRFLGDYEPEEEDFSLIATLTENDTCFVDTVSVPDYDDADRLYYCVTDVDASNNESDIDYFLKLHVPNSPIGISGSVSSPGLHPVITWNQNIDLDLKGYNIYKMITAGDSTIMPFTRINTEILIDTTWTDSSFVVFQQGQETANYYVTGVNWRRGESAPSDTLHGVGRSVSGDDQSNLASNEDKKNSWFQASPNPFNLTTKLSFSIPYDNKVKIVIYDLQGRRIREIFEGFASAGETRVFTLNGTNLSSGIYICQLQADDMVQTQKLVLIK